MIRKILSKDKVFSTGDTIKGYEVINIIGEGRYGIAYIAKDKEGNKVVIKQLKEKMLIKSKDKVKYEEEILSKLNDSRFPKFLGKFNCDNKKGYILEYFEGITFEKEIYINKKIFNDEEIFNVGCIIIDMIKELNNHGIVHKDIRVSNVVIMNNNSLGLIDFGLARYIDKAKYKIDEDYWYLADFLIHLHYTGYDKKSIKNKPWYEELEVDSLKITFLKKLMNLEEGYESIEKVEKDFIKFYTPKKQANI